MVTIAAAVQRRSSWCDLCKEGATGILLKTTRQMTQQRNEESRELIDCLAQAWIMSIGN